MKTHEKLATLALCLGLSFAGPAFAAEPAHVGGTWGVVSTPGTETDGSGLSATNNTRGVDQVFGWRTVAPAFCHGFGANNTAVMRFVATDRTYYDTVDAAMIAILNLSCITGRRLSVFTDTESTWSQLLVNSQ